MLHFFTQASYSPDFQKLNDDIQIYIRPESRSARKKLTKAEFELLDSGQDIHEAMMSAADPSAVEVKYSRLHFFAFRIMELFA